VRRDPVSIAIKQLSLAQPYHHGHHVRRDPVSIAIKQLSLAQPYHHGHHVRRDPVSIAIKQLSLSSALFTKSPAPSRLTSKDTDQVFEVQLSS
jgi:hypothetical protein